MTIQAIETRYAGCVFRSRLEARWAVFFDELGIEWEYEPQGFETEGVCWSSGGRYLPDFYLPNLHNCDWGGPGVYVEVKGSDASVDPRKLEVMADLIDFGGPLANGLLLLGPIPDAQRATLISHMLLVHDKGVRVKWACLGSKTMLVHSLLRHWCPNEGACIEGDMARATWEPMSHRVGTVGGGDWSMGTKISTAYAAARSARFEHGHSGAVR